MKGAVVDDVMTFEKRHVFDDELDDEDDDLKDGWIGMDENDFQ